jgi:hypothetical protein
MIEQLLDGANWAYGARPIQAFLELLPHRLDVVLRALHDEVAGMPKPRHDTTIGVSLGEL